MLIYLLLIEGHTRSTASKFGVLGLVRATASQTIKDNIYVKYAFDGVLLTSVLLGRGVNPLILTSLSAVGPVSFKSPLYPCNTLTSLSHPIPSGLRPYPYHDSRDRTQTPKTWPFDDPKYRYMYPSHVPSLYT